MRKQLIFLLSGLLLVFGIVLTKPVVAAASNVEDRIGLFDPDEIIQLSAAIEEVNPQFKGNLFVITTDDSQQKVADFADDYLLTKVGANKNASVLVINMSQREIYVSTSGNMIDYITSKRLNEMLDEMYEEMTVANYYGAAEIFVQRNAEYIEAGIPNKNYQVDSSTGKIIYKKQISLLELIIGLVLASLAGGGFFIYNNAKYQLKAKDYRYAYRENSQLELTGRNDRLVNSFVRTRRIPKPSNNGGGSGGTHSRGGGSFGGGGRKF
ncbi:uncharacterized protein M2139_002785 [Enterococcus sp. PF1-24]|uniref:TPM domain-containing protein n=1 Tax=unclassified Enterococcus TaxID=2608891 RepID=UPI00247438D5|nr:MULTISPECIES: TPM domain-containing protein [unclassified Enterococcus]MDH6365762.1 uncharacterized protein [Enterococcus sp. PFB1-1]MDH6402855.1 uncharacterized protein [Enterococcus sp. PF1-24]